MLVADSALLHQLSLLSLHLSQGIMHLELASNFVDMTLFGGEFWLYLCRFFVLARRKNLVFAGLPYLLHNTIFFRLSHKRLVVAFRDYDRDCSAVVQLHEQQRAMAAIRYARVHE